MLILKINFPAHRYHATPWGNHVNEGLVEWPPSPWRLVRTFCSVGFTHIGWQGEPPREFAELVDTLCDQPPAYHLPPSVVTHSRHYMPVPGTTSKVLDAWRRIVDGHAVFVRFDASLPDDQLSLLKSLVEHTSYLGRAESWVNVELIEEEPQELTWCEATATTSAQLGAASQRVLMPMQDAPYQTWREQQLEQALEREQQTRGKKLTQSQRIQIESAFPNSVVDCLSIDTHWMSRHGWSQPPGTQWVAYMVEEKPIPRSHPVTQVSTKPSSPLPTTAVISLTSDTVSGANLTAGWSNIVSRGSRPQGCCRVYGTADR